MGLLLWLLVLLPQSPKAQRMLRLARWLVRVSLQQLQHPWGMLLIRLRLPRLTLLLRRKLQCCLFLTL